MSKEKYKNPDIPLEDRVDDLIDRMTLEEKVTQMLYYSSAIGRLGIPEYNWWNECLHGVARAGTATVFPQAIAMGATFNDQLINKTADTIADEARAKYNQFVKQEDRGIYKGLTFWTPNINIFRDPRWGRGQETYGEDPYLTGRMGVSFIKGLQGDHPKYLKTAACAKHYAVHSGPEIERHEFDAVVNKKDLRETYLPAFRDAVKEAEVEAVMGAYNRVNGEPACAHTELMEKILRGEWGFEGHYVSDCGAIEDIHKNHKVKSTPEESAAMGVNIGCDLNCGRVYESLKNAINEGLITEETVDKSLRRLFNTRFKLGMFDPEEDVPFNEIPYEVNDSDDNRELACEVARESMVLLKNEDDLLPLNKDEINSIAVIGPNAADKEVLLANYSGTPSKYVTVLEGIRNAVNDDTRLYYAKGCDLTTTEVGFWGNQPTSGFAEALTAAEKSDVVVICMGLSPEFEGEEGEVANSDGGGDKLDLNFPGMQLELLKAVAQTGKPVIVVLLNGSPLELNWIEENIPAVVEAWYPGEEGGTAVADVLFGKYNPAGRLPITFVESMDQLPPFRDYSMKNRTYRYMEEKPLYPFGYGLSYTTFAYQELKLDYKKVSTEDDVALTVTLEVENKGNTAGDEVVQLYIKDLKASVDVPRWELKRYKRINLKPGDVKQVEFKLNIRDFSIIDNEGIRLVEPGTFRIYAGGQQPDERSKELTGIEVLSSEVEVTGSTVELEY